MRELVIGSFVSLDGVMQAPGGPDEDRDGGFRHGGWAVPYFDEMMVQNITEWVAMAGGFLLGRRTYEIFAEHWPRSTDPNDTIGVALNQRPKYVASRTLSRVDWHNSTLLGGDVVEAIRGLKVEDGGEIQVHGSPNFIQTLLKHDLVDKLRIWQFPVVLGGGKRLFGEDVSAGAFELVETQVSTTGAVLQVYNRAGDLRYGIAEVGEEMKVLE